MVWMLWCWQVLRAVALFWVGVVLLQNGVSMTKKWNDLDV